MSTEQTTTATPSQGGAGPLARLVATRDGRAAPEAPFVIEHREALIYMLCEAAELEHAVMCQYLFAAFSLKRSLDEGLTEPQLAAVQRWRRQVSHVATQEMLHLALVQNLLTAIGAAPHLSRPNLPAPAGHYPAGVQLALIPFGEQALRHFVFLERPEGMDLADAQGMAATGPAVPHLNERDIVPQGQDFATVGHLYRSIEAGLAHLAAEHGEDWLFVGPPRAQATPDLFGWPELVAVTDLASAQRAIDEIVEQGEGPRGDWRSAHFGQFVAIFDEYQQLTEAEPDFDPVRPVLAANVRARERDAGVPLVEDQLSAGVSDLFNVVYEVVLQLLQRFFAHTEETDAQLKVLADATVALMVRVIEPIGDLLTTLPVGDSRPGRTAGPSFELFYESDYLLPHREAAWALLAERIDQAAWLGEELRTGRGAAIGDRLEPALAALREISGTVAANLQPHFPQARLASSTARLTTEDVKALVSRAEALARSAAEGADGIPELAELFATVQGIVADAATGQGCGPADRAVVLPRLVDSVLRPLAEVLGGSAVSDGPRGAGPATGIPAPRPAEAPPAVSDRVWDAARAATGLRVALAEAKSCPPRLAEATAALQDLACRLTSPAEAAIRQEALWQQMTALPAGIQAVRNGPELVTNVARLVDHLGAQTRPAPQLALCRCGASAITPLCDGSHARIGFTDAKDPHRVPDRRDSHPGQQVTVLDNRGICQHSGLCTDRLPTVFRTGADPFVAASGGRMDEIIRAVRDCPSGALSFALDGVEARDQVDRAGTRPPAVEVIRDGPYRITGRIPVVDDDGVPVVRNQGSSLEHCALCRCGHSQNKPFCSGMHWHVGFSDPPRGHEPTLFEWAGGLPGLVRAARLLYERYVPDDSLLAAGFATMTAEQPWGLAGWLAEAFGGPARDGGDDDLLAGVVGWTGGAFGETQRARWVVLFARAADAALLPGDAAFRAPLASAVEWLSRTAMEGGRAPRPTPRWDWAPGGPPPPDRPERAAGAAGEVALATPDQPVGFADHIRPLFREQDRQSMRFAFDLWAFDDVRAHAADVLERVQDGSMPCDRTWPPGQVDVFRRWMDAGMRP